jgi:acetolactate synthase I/III small subunit
LIEWIGRKPLFWPPISSAKIPEPMRHIIAIHLQNEAGALTRVTGLFSTRGYNIESLSVAATDDPSVSRVTLTTKGADGVILQIVNQLNKLIDVVAVEDLTRGEHIERELVGELVVLKLRVEPQLIDSVRGYVVRAGGRVLEPSPEGFVVELTASEAEVNQFVTHLGERTDIVEVVRSGALAVGRNARALHVVR